MDADLSVDEEFEWCEARDSLLAVPSGIRIEVHARQWLNRILSTRPPIAFVGSGASMAYGRLGWGDAARAMQRDVLRRAEGHRDSRSVDSLCKLLESVAIDKADGISDSRDLLAIFQLCEQLAGALVHEKATAESFRSRIKQLLRDDRGHAEFIIDEAIRSPTSSRTRFEFSLAARKEKGKEDPRNVFGTTAFTRGVLTAVRLQLRERTHIAHAGSLEMLLLDALDAFYPNANDNDPVAPYHRFIVGAALRLIGEPNAQQWDLRGQLLGIRFNEKTAAWDCGVTWRSAADFGISLLPRNRDPLYLLLRLDIARFLTTNYDFEIEECLNREGLTYDGETPSASMPRDPLAKYWRQSQFDRNHVGHLLSFVARDGRRIKEIVHLHGRAGEGEEIVVTNEDYQNHYLTIHDQRAGMEAAVAAAFGGHPLLFVGLGMGEDDLLRPLRQFVGEKSPPEGRIAIAILPATKANGDRDINLEKVRNLQRYGVYTIHVGHAEGVDEFRRADKKEIPERWLTRLSVLKSKLDGVLGLYRTFLSGKIPIDSITLQQRWRDTVNSADRVFSPDRPLRSPTAIEGVAIDPLHNPELGIGRELGIFNSLLEFARRIANDGEKSQELTLELVDAASYALNECMSSIVGAFLCAGLISMNVERERFAAEIMRPPEPQEPAALVRMVLNLDTARRGPREPLWLRHSLLLASAPERDSYTEDTYRRFYGGAPSKTFNDLEEALRQKKVQEVLQSLPNGRRIFVFIAPRGHGKGHFFAALSEKRLDLLRECLGNGQSAHPWAAAFFNCGLSHEVTSVFDTIPEVMIQAADITLRRAAAAGTDQEADLSYRRARLDALIEVRSRHDRLGRLEQVFQAFGEAGILPTGERIILAIHGMSVLFNRDGQPKNAQVHRLFDILLGKLGAGAPVDFVFVSSEGRLPECFRWQRDPSLTHDPMRLTPVPTRLITNLNWSEKVQRDARLRSRIIIGDELQRETESIDSGDGQAFAYFLRPTRASIMATAYFPSVALVVALDTLQHLTERRNQPPIYPNEALTGWGLHSSPDLLLAPIAIHQFEQRTAASTRWTVKQVLESAEKPETAVPKLLAHAAIASVRGPGLWHEKVFPDAYRFELPTELHETDLIEELGKGIDARMRELFRACGESRIGFTLLMSTAYQFLVPVADSKTRRSREPQDVEKAVFSCKQFLASAQIELDASPRERRVEMVIEITMRTLFSLDSDPTVAVFERWNRLKRGQPTFFAFQRTILWQLAVIGQPIVAEVLARSPAVLRFYSKYVDASLENSAKECVWFNTVVECLALLEHRCLVFYVSPHEPSHKQDVRKNRYAVHAQIQLHVFRHMHSPFIEYPEVDQFAVTLFAHQVNDLPRLNSTAREELSSTVAEMIGYPTWRGLGDAPRSWPQTSEDDSNAEAERKLVIRAQLLKAALGILRSVYSIGTVARRIPESSAKSTTSNSSKRQTMGVLEEHCSIIHWMIRQSKALDHAYASMQTTDPPQRPFYSEELCWLYNEAGVLSYSRGRMIEAASFFQRADHTAHEHIEPSQDGAVRTRIALNWVLVDIDRGRLDVAEARLSRILLIRDEQPVIQRLASGYLGLVQHIRGRYQAANEHYRTALDNVADSNGGKSTGLLSLNRTRAASIISRHYGDLLRSQGEASGAKKMHAQSATLAIEGGHEDIRHHTRLSMLRLRLSKFRNQDEVSNSGDRHEIHKELDVVEDFALDMGMPRLHCDVDLVRAELHQLDGDFASALSVASRGLTTASTNDLRLRKTRFLLRLAELFERRERISECRQVLEEAFELARETQYHTAREEGQSIFARIGGRSQ